MTFLYFTKYQDSGVMLSVGLCGRNGLSMVICGSVELTTLMLVVFPGTRCKSLISYVGFLPVGRRSQDQH